MEEMKRVRCAIVRGGTSKAVFIMENELPSDPTARDRVVLSIFGSPDKRQIDGLGGADPPTSKLAIIGPPDGPDYDVKYTFGQVDIENPNIVYTRNCGNISSAVGPFAIDEGLVKAVEPITKVRVYVTSTKQFFTAHVPVREGKAKVEGDYQIDGVPGTGAKILLDYSQKEGAASGKILPTDHAHDAFDIDGVGKLDVSIIDFANLFAFVKAQDIGLKGTELPPDIDQNKDILNKLEAIRDAAAKTIGGKKPGIAFVSQPTSYRSFLNTNIEKKDIDFVSRQLFMGRMHKVYGGTTAVATSVAAMIDGTVVNDVSSEVSKKTGIVRIGHPCGVMDTEVKLTKENDRITVRKASYARTARRIMDGYVYVKRSLYS